MGVKKSVFGNTPASLNMLIGAFDLNGTPQWFTNRQLSFIFIGGELGTTKSLALYNAFQALMTYYGTQV